MTDAIKNGSYCAVTPFCWAKCVMRKTLNKFLSLAFLQNFSRWEVDARKIVFSEIIQEKFQHFINCSRLATVVQNEPILILPRICPTPPYVIFFSSQRWFVTVFFFFFALINFWVRFMAEQKLTQGPQPLCKVCAAVWLNRSWTRSISCTEYPKYKIT
jgi:hypothetical protein